MSTGALDPLIHDPERLRIVATLAALPDGDALSVTRLQDMIGLTPGSLITSLRELGDAGYVRTGKTGGGTAPAAVALTRDGRAALDRYTAVLRQLPPDLTVFPARTAAPLEGWKSPGAAGTSMSCGPAASRCAAGRCRAGRRTRRRRWHNTAC